MVGLDRAARARSVGYGHSIVSGRASSPAGRLPMPGDGYNRDVSMAKRPDVESIPADLDRFLGTFFNSRGWRSEIKFDPAADRLYLEVRLESRKLSGRRPLPLAGRVLRARPGRRPAAAARVCRCSAGCTPSDGSELTTVLHARGSSYLDDDARGSRHAPPPRLARFPATFLRARPPRRPAVGGGPRLRRRRRRRAASTSPSSSPCWRSASRRSRLSSSALEAPVGAGGGRPRRDLAGEPGARRSVLDAARRPRRPSSAPAARPTCCAPPSRPPAAPRLAARCGRPLSTARPASSDAWYDADAGLDARAPAAGPPASRRAWASSASRASRVAAERHRGAGRWPPARGRPRDGALRVRAAARRRGRPPLGFLAVGDRDDAFTAADAAAARGARPSRVAAPARGGRRAAAPRRGLRRAGRHRRPPAAAPAAAGAAAPRRPRRRLLLPLGQRRRAQRRRLRRLLQPLAGHPRVRHR